MTKKRLFSGFRAAILAVAVLASVSVLAACGSGGKQTPAANASASSAQQAVQDNMKVTIADTLTNPVFRVAKTKGILDKYGIDAEIATFATPAEGINSLFIKQSDVAFGADFPVLNAVSKGEYSIIASTGTGQTDESAAGWKLFVRDNIRQPADLKGKKVSTLRGTFVPYLWDEYLTSQNVSLDDVELIGQGGFDEAYIALKKGEIDAAWVYGSAMIAKFEAIEGARQLTDMSQTRVRIGGDLIVPDALIREHPEGVANLLRALDESSRYIAAHPDETADILYKETKQPKDATLKDLALNNWNIGFTQEAFDGLSGLKKYMIDNGIIQHDFDLDGKIYLDAIRQAAPDRVTYGK